MVSNDYLLRGSIPGGLIKFAMPVMLSMLLQILYSATDLVIVGNFATTADMSGVTVSSQVLTTITLGMAGITTGLTVLLGQYSGAGDKKSIKLTIGSAIAFFAILSVTLAVLLFCMCDFVVAAMKTPQEAIDAARSYLRICALGIIFIVGYNVTSGILRGLGNSKAPLIFVAIACGINIVLDLVFIKGFGMGATGAALATVIAQAGSLLFSIIYLKRNGLGLELTRDDFKLRSVDRHVRLEYIKKILRIGLPISLQEILVNVSFLLITAVVNDRMGLSASASVGTVEKLISFLMMPTMAISIAVATMAAHNYGARQYTRASKCLWSGIYISLGFAVLVCAFCWFDGTALTALFSKDPKVITDASLYLRTYSLDCIGVAFVFNFNGYFSSCNKSVFAMIHSLTTTFLIRVPFVIIAGGLAGVTLLTIGIAAPLSSFGSLAMCLFYYRWLRREMKRDKALGNIGV